MKLTVEILLLICCSCLSTSLVFAQRGGPRSGGNARSCREVADEFVTSCSRNCMERDDDGCLECMEGCSGVDEDECDENGCSNGGICVARGTFAMRECFMSVIEDGQVCQREDEGVQETYFWRMQRARQMQRGMRTRRNMRNFRPVNTPCKDGSVCVPYDGTTDVCKSMDLINGPCFDDSMGLQCDSDGNFLTVQCSDDTCWCVYPENGTEIPYTRVGHHRAGTLPDCFDQAYESCVIVVRGDRYRVEHNRFGLDVSNCRRCICQNGKLNDSTCVNGRSCVFITPGGKKSCKYNGTKYSNGEVFPIDECNTCKCLNGEITECTHMECNMNPTCEQCECMPEELVCCEYDFGIGTAPFNLTVCNECVAQFCPINGQRPDPDSCTNGPCSVNPESVCRTFPCEEGLTCLPSRALCSTIGGCSQELYRMCINETNLECPVVDGEEVCGSDGKTYSSVCRLVLETDNVYPIYDGHCNRTECQNGPVCGSDRITYPSICVLQSLSPHARFDYEGACVEPEAGDLCKDYSARVQSQGRCRNLTGCEHIVQPTDGACPICGGIAAVAIDERGLDEYSELFEEVRTLDGLLTHVVGSGTIPDDVLDVCEISAYITTTINLEFIFEAINTTESLVCFMAAKDFANFINGQGDGDTSKITPDPVVSFLTAATTLEQEEGGSTTVTPGDSGTSQVLPPALLLLSIILYHFV